MSLINRTLYLASLVEKFKKIIQPIIEQYNTIASIVPDDIVEIAEKYDTIKKEITEQSIGKLDEATKSQLAKLNAKKEEEINKYKEKIASVKKKLQDQIAEIAQKAADEIDGIEVEIKGGETLTVIPKPKLFNPVTDFVKNSLTSPETMVMVNTVVTGTSVTGGPVTAVGIQPNAKILTT